MRISITAAAMTLPTLPAAKTASSTSSAETTTLVSSEVAALVDTDPLMSAGSSSPLLSGHDNNRIEQSNGSVAAALHVPPPSQAATAKTQSSSGNNSISTLCVSAHSTASTTAGTANNVSSNSSSGGESVCNSPSYQRAQNNYSLPPINGMACFKSSANNQSGGSSRKNLNVTGNSSSTGASPLSSTGSSVRRDAVAYEQQQQHRQSRQTGRAPDAASQNKAVTKNNGLLVRERSVSANNIPSDSADGMRTASEHQSSLSHSPLLSSLHDAADTFDGVGSLVVTVPHESSQNTAPNNTANGNNHSLVLSDGTHVTLMSGGGGHHQQHHVSPSSGTGSIYSPPNNGQHQLAGQGQQHQFHQNAASNGSHSVMTAACNNNSSSSLSSASYTTLMPLQLTALPPIASVSDKFATSPLRMFGTTPVAGNLNVTGATGTSINGNNGRPVNEQPHQLGHSSSRSTEKLAIRTAVTGDNGAMSDSMDSSDAGSVVFMADHHHGQSSSINGENGGFTDQAMSAFSSIDASLMGMSGTDVGNDGLLGDFHTHDPQLQHIDNFSLPLQPQHQSLSDLQQQHQQPIQYYQQNPYSHLVHQHHPTQQPIRFAVGPNLFSTSTDTIGSQQLSSATYESLRPNNNAADSGIHLHIGSAGNNSSNNVIMMGGGGNAFDPYGLDQFTAAISAGDNSLQQQFFTTPLTTSNSDANNGSSRHQNLNSSNNTIIQRSLPAQNAGGNDVRLVKTLISQQQPQQQQQQLAFVTIQGQMPVGAIKITIPTQQYPQPQQQQQQFYASNSGQAFLPTAIINSDGRIIVPSNMLFTGPNGQTYLVNPACNTSSASAMSFPTSATTQSSSSSMHPELATEVIVTSSMPLSGLEFSGHGAGDYDDNDLAGSSAPYETKQLQQGVSGNKPEMTDDAKDASVKWRSRQPATNTSNKLGNVINKLTTKAQQQQQQRQLSAAIAGASTPTMQSATTSSQQVAASKRVGAVIKAAAAESKKQQQQQSVVAAVKAGTATGGAASTVAKSSTNALPAKSAVATGVNKLPTAPDVGGGMSSSATTTKGFIVRPVNSLTKNGNNTAVPTAAVGTHRFATLASTAVRAPGTVGAVAAVRKYQPLPVIATAATLTSVSSAPTANNMIAASSIENLLIAGASFSIVNNHNNHHPSGGVIPEGESLSSASSLTNCGEEGCADGNVGGSTTDSDGDDDNDRRSSSSISNPEEDAEMEKVNTRDLSQRVSAELKRYSIPQAVFAQRVLCRSQGTLSDLLRNPKPWSKLKSGRETFRRMWRWLQEPEFQRMSALRLAACKRKDIDSGLFGPPTTDATVAATSAAAESSSQSSFTSGDDDDDDIVAASNNSEQAQNDDDNEDNEAEAESKPAAKRVARRSSSAAAVVASPAASARVQQLVAEAQTQQGKAAQLREQIQQQVGADTPSQTHHHHHNSASKKPRLVFTDIQKRTLVAIFKETRRPSKDMQLAIAQQLGLDITTVSNFFMNARRRSQDKWLDDGVDTTATKLADGKSHATSSSARSSKRGVTTASASTKPN